MELKGVNMLMKNLKQVIDENNREIAFNMFDSKLVVSAERNVYNQIFSKYEKIAENIKNEFIKYLDEMSNLDEFFESVFQMFLLSLESGINEIAKDAISVGIYTYDLDTILSECMKKNYFSSFEEMVELYEKQDEQIISALSNAATYRAHRKNSRSRWSTITYGGSMLDAWSNQMKANTMNAIEGLGHSVINAIGNSLDESEANEKRRSLFRDEYYRKKLINSVWTGARNLRLFVTNIVSQEAGLSLGGWVTSQDQKEAEAIFNNLTKFDMPEDKKKELMLKIFDLNPYSQDYYEYCLKTYFENVNEILNLASFFNMDEVKNQVVNIVTENIKSKSLNTPEEYISFRKELLDQISKTGIEGEDEINIISVLESQGKEILRIYVAENIGESEEEALICKDKINQLKNDMGINTDISDVVKIINDKLTEIDIKLRTVSGVVFGTREEAANAKSEVEDNKDVLENVEYICVHDYIEHIQKIKQLSIAPSLIAEYVSNVNYKMYLFKEQCQKAKKHDYRLNHRNTLLWNGNTKDMILKYVVLLPLVILTLCFTLSFNIGLAVICFLATNVLFHFLFVSKAKDSEKAWCEVTKRGRYALSDIMDQNKPLYEIKESDLEYEMVNNKKAVKSLLLIFLVPLLLMVFFCVFIYLMYSDEYKTAITNLEIALNENDSEKIYDSFFPKGMIKLDKNDKEQVMDILSFDLSDVEYDGDMWDIYEVEAVPCDTSDVETYLKDELDVDVKVKKAYLVNAKLRIGYSDGECQFNVFKTQNNKWGVSTNFWEGIYMY